jgi:hypothetical protein
MVIFDPAVIVAGTQAAPVDPMQTSPFVNAAVEVGAPPEPPPKSIPYCVSNPEEERTLEEDA